MSHQFDPLTEGCVFCGVARMDCVNSACPGGKRPKEWLLLTPRGPVWMVRR